MTKKKLIAIVTAAVLVICCAVAGTLAWLTSTSDPVVNTFTPSDIDVTLVETKTNFQMVPGYTIEKDPKVTVKAGSEDCYLFIKVEKSAVLDDYIAYAIAAGWEQLKDEQGVKVEGVYYRTVSKVDSTREFSILGTGSYPNAASPEYTWSDNQVLVKPTVTKKMMNDLEATNATKPTLTFTAYASQYMRDNTTSFSAIEAWNNVKPTTTP